MTDEDSDWPECIVPVILSGGAGSRLWPLSRAGHPKQFLPLVGERSLIQQAVRRVAKPPFAEPVVICNEDHRFLVAEHLRQEGIRPSAILLEPVGRNTAPATAVASLHLLNQMEADTEALMLVMPSDHVIGNLTAFLSAVKSGCAAARRGHLVTFAVAPSHPETGYGYIQVGEPLDGMAGIRALGQFVEKPDGETAAKFVTDESYFWNSGIFLFGARAFLSELDIHAPAIVSAARAALAGAVADLDFLRLDVEGFSASPSDSIDYAIMEHTTRGAVVPVDMSWSDLGSWSSLWQVGEKDAAGNVVHGDVLAQDTCDSYLRAASGMVAAVGLENVIVVATDDVVLVADRASAGDVKCLVERVRAEGREEFNLHTMVQRPWGSYRGIDRGDRYQVKRIVVHPGEKLSLQRHYHRAEHWVVVHGTARVTRGGDSFLLRENESAFIPAGELHRLENPGKIPVHLIEVQSGAYLGEDDIERFDDGYGRSVGKA